MRMKTRSQTRKTFGYANHVSGVQRFLLVKETSCNALIVEEIAQYVLDYE